MSVIASLFAEHFRNWSITLPAHTVRERCNGEISQAGWHIHFLWGQDDTGGYLDYYAQHRMTNDRHVRIRESGEIEHLPAVLDMIIYPPNATEEQEQEAQRRVQEHNERVWAELRQKGF